MPLADNFAGGMKKTVGSLAADMDGIARLQNVELFNDFKHQVRDFTDTIFAITGDATDIDIGEIVVGATFTGSDANFWRFRMVVDFNPEAAQ